MKIKNVDGELIIPVTLLDSRQSKYLTVRQVRAYIVNKELVKKTAREYSKHFRFLRSHKIWPVVNDLWSIMHTTNGQDLFQYGDFHTDHNLLQYVYPGYGVAPYEKRIPFYRTQFPGIVKFTANRNVINVHIPKEYQVPGVYNLVVKIEVEHTHRVHKDVWEIELDCGEFNIIGSEYHYVYSEADDDSAIVYAGTSESDIVTVTG